MSSPGQSTKKDGPPIAEAHNAICISPEQATAFDLAMGERRFEDWPVKSVGRLLVRAEPQAIPGGGSALTATGGNAGHRRGQGWSKAQS